MILITDSGSTKTDWILISNQKQTKIKTLGLNPAILSATELKNRILESKELINNINSVKQIYFYGAGCGTSKPKNKLLNILNTIFTNATSYVFEDTLAAIYAVTKEPAIVCILGTGSNCTYFNGTKNIQKVASLGYTIMDEASGNYYGRELIKNYYYNQMPIDLALAFENEYNLEADDIKYNLYQQENPNAYLASFTPFLIKNKQHDFMQTLIYKGLNLFVKNHISQYAESKQVPIHFVGSIAYLLSHEIKAVLKKHGLTLGKIEQKPINGLIHHHTNTN